MEAVLTIAGSDSSGGAGIQADLKTIAAHHLFGMSAITALTAQNTTGVVGVEEVEPSFIVKQIDAVFDDIRPAAVKIGMVSSPDAVMAIAQALQRQQAEHIVVDPVMMATSGASLASDESVGALVQWLFPLAEVITPNIPEACCLSRMQIESPADMERAAETIAQRVSPGAPDSGGVSSDEGVPMQATASDVYEYGADQCPPSEAHGAAVLVKGGHADEGFDAPAAMFPDEATGTADDVLCLADGTLTWLRGARIDTANTHGTGCTLSSAIACGLARGLSVQKAVVAAKNYVRGALAAGLNLGHGPGPLDHMWVLDEREANP